MMLDVVLLGLVRRYEQVPSQSLAYGGDQVESDSWLCDVAKGTGREATSDKIGVRVNGQKNDSGIAPCSPQLFGGFDTIQQRHRNICDNYIGLQVHRCFKQSLPVAHLSNNFERCLQKTLDELGKVWVIISN